MGVPVTATPTEIHNQYIYKAQLLHPDKTAALPGKARQKAEQELKVVNTAYSILKDPKNNLLVTPPKLRVSPKHIFFNDIGPGQKKTTIIHIESIGGVYTKFWMSESPASWLKVIEVKSTTNDPLPLEATIEATGGEILGKHYGCNLPVRIENEKTGAKNEVSVKIELLGSNKGRQHELRETRTQNIAPFVLANHYKAILLVLISSIIGLIINAFISSYIPFWILLGFSTAYLVDKWFGYPTKKHKTLGIFYRLLLNLGILSCFGFIVWSGGKLFSHQFLGTPLIGSFVFLSECLFFIWIWRIVNKNRRRVPSMKLTIFVLISIFLVFSFAGVQPFAKYKDKMILQISSYYNKLSP